MIEEPLEIQFTGASTLSVAWTDREDGPCNLIGRKFPALDMSSYLTAPADDSERLANRSAFLSEIRINPNRTAVPRLQHGGVVRYVTTHNPFLEDLQCDALVTDRLGFVLTMTFADCPPVVLFDDEAKVLGVIHAGWKPIAAGIIENTLEKMLLLGAHRTRINVFIGPGVRKCCYEVGPDVATAVDGLPYKGHVHIDLSDIILARLLARGVSIANIKQHPTCTACGVVDNGKTQKPLYYSYRRDKKKDPLDAQMLAAWIS